MMSSLGRYAPGGLLLIALVGVGWPAETTRAADQSPSQTAAKSGGNTYTVSLQAQLSAQQVPADATFYAAMLRNRELYDIVRQSRAWTVLKGLPVFKQAQQALQEQLAKPDGPLAAFNKFKEQPENQELLDLVCDGVSHEIFVYGGPRWIEFLELAQRVNTAQGFSPFLSMLGGKTGPELQQAQLRATLQALNKNRDLIMVPEFVVGFKLTDTKRAEAQIKRLEKLLQSQLAKHEELKELKDRLTRVQVGKGSFLTLKLDGSLVPWDKVPLKDIEEKEGQFDDLVKKLKALHWQISLGVRDGYLLLVSGESTEAILEKFGGAGQHLTDLPAFKPLAKFADARLTSVAYASGPLQQKAASGGLDPESLLQLVRQSKLSAGQRQQIEKTIKELGKDLKSVQPELGPVLEFEFLTNQGSEGYTYHWGKEFGVDASKPLTLLDHLGGAPLIAAVGRAKHNPAHYQLLVKWLKIAGQYMDEAAARLPDEQKKEYEKWSKALRPLLVKLNEANVQDLQPALADGQMGLVLDAKWTSKQWFPGQPESAKPLPMIEPALILGVSDAAAFRKGATEYFSVVKELFEKLNDLAPDKIPSIPVPDPETKQVKGGTLYTWPLRGFGQDERWAPTAGLSEHVAVMTLSEQHAERLLADHPLKIQSKLLQANDKKPLAGMTFVNWAGLVDAAAPWVELAIPEIVKQRGGQAAEDENVKKETAAMLRQARAILTILKVLRSHSSITYKEEGALVTHEEEIFRDLVAAPAKPKKAAAKPEGGK